MQSLEPETLAEQGLVARRRGPEQVADPGLASDTYEGKLTAPQILLATSHARLNRAEE